MLALLVMAGMVLTVPASDAASPLFVKVEGKSIVAVKEINPYVATAIGGPGEGSGGNYSFVIALSGKDVSDALISPANGITKTGVFNFNLTAPSAATDMTILVNVTSERSNGEKATLVRSFFVRSVVPIVISAKVVNQGSMALDSVPVYFYVDGKKLDQRLISLAAGGSKVVTYNWTEGVLQGQHEVRVELDPDGQFARFESGGTVYTQTIWVGMSDFGNTDAILIGTLVLFFFLSYLVYKRPTPKRRKK